MLLSVFDIDLLRLLRWCQYANPSDLLPFYDNADLSNLISTGLLKIHRGSGALLLTGKGHDLLQDIFGDKLPGAYQTYRAGAIQRRLHLARLMLLFYRAGAMTFLTQIEELCVSASFFLPSMMRGRGRNPWGNTRVAAIASLPGTLCAVHYVQPGIGKLLLADELAAFTNNTSTLGEKRRTLIFAGESYPDILSELEADMSDTGSRLISYGEAYRRSPLPVHLLSCDETGVLQLRIMSQPDYRRRLTQTILKGRYRPPLEGTDCDALFDGAPFLLTVDMNLQRIDNACNQQRACGGMKPVVAALEGQAETVLNARYRDRGLARVFTVTDAALREFLGSLPNPAEQLFLSPKGDVIHAPLIQARRKTGEPR